MQQSLRFAGAFAFVVGVALWFFGGMNTGASRWTEEPQSASPEHRVAEEPRHVFRPGRGFLFATTGIAATLVAGSFLPLRRDR